MFKIILISLVLTTVNAVKPNPTETYPNQLTLQQPDLFFVYWKHDNYDITFELHYKNVSKWALFGIGGQSFSDVIVGWMNDDQTGHFSDRKYDSSANKLDLDTKQNWFILDAFKKDEYTVLKFSKKIRVCDDGLKNEDLDVSTGLVTLVYATGSTLTNQDIQIQSINSLNFVLLQTAGPFNCETKPNLTFTSSPTAVYAKYIDLVANGQYRFYWNYTQTELIGEIHCRTSGWVGFGLSPNGNMDKSDVVIGWISNGVTNFTVILTD